MSQPSSGLGRGNPVPLFFGPFSRNPGRCSCCAPSDTIFGVSANPKTWTSETILDMEHHLAGHLIYFLREGSQQPGKANPRVVETILVDTIDYRRSAYQDSWVSESALAEISNIASWCQMVHPYIPQPLPRNSRKGGNRDDILREFVGDWRQLGLLRLQQKTHDQGAFAAPSGLISGERDGVDEPPRDYNDYSPSSDPRPPGSQAPGRSAETQLQNVAIEDDWMEHEAGGVAQSADAHARLEAWGELTKIRARMDLVSLYELVNAASVLPRAAGRDRDGLIQFNKPVMDSFAVFTTKQIRTFFPHSGLTDATYWTIFPPEGATNLDRLEISLGLSESFIGLPYPEQNISVNAIHCSAPGSAVRQLFYVTGSPPMSEPVTGWIVLLVFHWIQNAVATQSSSDLRHITFLRTLLYIFARSERHFALPEAPRRDRSPAGRQLGMLVACILDRFSTAKSGEDFIERGWRVLRDTMAQTLDLAMADVDNVGDQDAADVAFVAADAFHAMCLMLTSRQLLNRPASNQNGLRMLAESPKPFIDRLYRRMMLSDGQYRLSATNIRVVLAGFAYIHSKCWARSEEVPARPFGASTPRSLNGEEFRLAVLGFSSDGSV